jgi:hypothetical protein
MATERVRTGSDWLALREPADAAARSPELVEVLRAHLPTDGLVIHDLGCGTGSMARWLAGQLDGPQRWVLHDRDAELLKHAAANPPARAADGAAVSVETRLDDVTQLDPGELAGVSLITASALLDMFSEEELGRFVTICAGAGCPVLITLSVVGRVELSPADPFDRRVMDAFNAHQRRRTTDGRLLGPDAAGAAADAFRERGLEVVVRPSPWRLGPDRSGLAAAWFTGWVDAACERAPELAGVAGPYAAQRLAAVAAGSGSVTVHHLDLLALARR